MKKLQRFLFLWGPAILWMVVIFAFSSRPRITVAETPIVNFVIFKFLHMIEYGILFLLLLRPSHLKKGRAFIFAFLFAVVYAVSDEIHQTYVPTREGRIRDVLIDTAGIAIMYMYIKKRPRLLKRTL